MRRGGWGRIGAARRAALATALLVLANPGVVDAEWLAGPGVAISGTEFRPGPAGIHARWRLDRAAESWLEVLVDGEWTRHGDGRGVTRDVFVGDLRGGSAYRVRVATRASREASVVYAPAAGIEVPTLEPIRFHRIQAVTFPAEARILIHTTTPGPVEVRWGPGLATRVEARPVAAPARSPFAALARRLGKAEPEAGGHHFQAILRRPPSGDEFSYQVVAFHPDGPPEGVTAPIRRTRPPRPRSWRRPSSLQERDLTKAHLLETSTTDLSFYVRRRRVRSWIWELERKGVELPLNDVPASYPDPTLEGEIRYLMSLFHVNEGRACDRLDRIIADLALLDPGVDEKLRSLAQARRKALVDLDQQFIRRTPGDGEPIELPRELEPDEEDLGDL